MLYLIRQSHLTGSLVLSAPLLFFSVYLCDFRRYFSQKSIL